MAINLTAKSKSREDYPWCPKCGAGNVTGPTDTKPRAPAFQFTRSWYCRQCWWKASSKLFDDALYAKAMAERKPKSRPDRRA